MTKEVSMDTKMSVEKRQAFLAETRVGIISIPEEGRGPLSVPVWYSYEPGGDIQVWTSEKSYKAKLLQKTSRISFCVQDTQPPYYKYVSIEGPFTIRLVDLERDIHPMALRYYGPVGGELYVQDIRKSDSWRNNLLICITPERWYSADYSEVINPAP
jgi:nitroimidazol reductase NimA-like FMN-containing flavoprotein (pyridoxamine 5'-phosphate oxidase superfamily)